MMTSLVCEIRKKRSIQILTYIYLNIVLVGFPFVNSVLYTDQLPKRSVQRKQLRDLEGGA